MTDKSARDEIARHYGAYEIGGSLDDMYESDREHCYDFADRLIAALEAGGFAVVPKKPTRTMLNAAVDVDHWRLGDISPLGFRCSPQQLFEECWSAMLAASNPKEEGR